MNNKYFFCYITLNGSNFIKQSIKSILNFCKESNGKIIIIEGSTRFVNPEDINEFGLSVDNTSDIINGFINDNENGFIIYKQLGRVNDKSDLRNAYLDEVKKYADDKSWVIVVDDDELYKKDDLMKLDDYLFGHQDIIYVYNPQYWFWKDMNHHCVINENIVKNKIKKGLSNNKIFYDLVGNELRQGQYHERIFKFNPGYRYIHHAVVTDNVGRDVYIDKHYEKNRIVYTGCPRYHYGYLEDPEHVYKRFLYYAERDCKLKKDEKDRIVSNANVNPYIMFLKGDEIVNTETGETYIQKGKRLYPEYEVYEFIGEHPQEINKED